MNELYVVLLVASTGLLLFFLGAKKGYTAGYTQGQGETIDLYVTSLWRIYSYVVKGDLESCKKFLAPILLRKENSDQ